MPKPGISAERLLAVAADSPDMYPQRLDIARKCTLVVGVTRSIYRTASFLDDRMLVPGITGSWVASEALNQATSSPTGVRPLHLILHTGHVGSTLLSRLLDELGNTLGLREPLPLRTLADAHNQLGENDSLISAEEFTWLADMHLRLWSRGYPDTPQCVLKATSSACRFAPWLLRRRPDMRAVYLNLRAEPYLTTLLAGENSPADLRGHGQERFRRLSSAAAGPVMPLHALSLGELAALGWLTESMTRHAVATQFPSQTLLLDFDALLANLAETMHQLAQHFAISCDARAISALVGSPILQRYSKAPEYTYGSEMRADILNNSRHRNADEIRAGMRWIENMTKLYPALADAAQTSGF